uniref:protein-serine/threonine phosphatase n=1 Tax=Opuntia streptacantha TaxID=393608 RepID=A0A7C9EXU5_OPUST
MGTYLSKPKTEKVSEDGENDRLRYGLSSMQGWRSSMEDAHAAIPDLDNSTSFFAVYDGHGGKAVAKFCAKFLRKELLTDEAYLAGDLSTSLRRVFLRMDEMINSNRNWRELLWDDIETDSGFDDEFYFASGETEQEADEGLAKEAVELSRDHKPELEGEQERILKAGGFIHEGRVNGTLNLARAIGIQSGPTICRRYGVQA